MGSNLVQSITNKKSFPGGSNKMAARNNKSATSNSATPVVTPKNSSFSVNPNDSTLTNPVCHNVQRENPVRKVL